MIAKNIFYFLVIIMMASCGKSSYIFTSFKEPANEGLRLLYSEDALQWKRFDTILMKPQVGKEKIMRDPSIVQDKHGVFHLVYTTEWRGGIGFGYAKSTDLLNWENVKYIPVMHQDTTVVNVWAPELYYDKKADEFTIIWASTIPYKFPKGIEDEKNNHRLYYTQTKDFIKFTDPGLYHDFGYSTIDAVLVKRKKKDYVLVFKDNTRPERNLKVGFGNDIVSNWQNVSQPLTQKFTEGPSVVKANGGYYIYYDAYDEKIYQALFTKDFLKFEKVTNVSFPLNHKHGTAIKVKNKYLKKLLTTVKFEK